MSTTQAELLRVIDEDPEEAAHWLLLSDWLQQQDDPRGELIAIDVALEADRGARKPELEERRKELLAGHAPKLLGETFSKVIAEGYGTVVWRRGFVDEVSYVGKATSHKRAVGWLVKLMGDVFEPFTFMRRLTLSGTDIEDLVPLVRFKHLGTLEIDSTKVTDISALAMLPRLRRLVVEDCEVAPAQIKALKAERRGIFIKGP